ncbi:MAG: 30S ribosomal protein S12 methylthiotransferase RimO [Firmicutes bacterium]|nr:30S ribosomal protein S12 methylthiotransferase RimO [Bacillota bacterium]
MKVGVVSLGCDKNRVDSEHIMALLISYGHIISQDVTKCDILFINTCAFIEKAKKEAIDTILEYAKYKGKHFKKMIVLGCLAQRYASEIFDELPEVDAFVGIRAYKNLDKIIDQVFQNKRIVDLNYAGELPHLRLITTPFHYAYLKIADGCNNNCSYCTIPKIRGKFTSGKTEDLVYEVKALGKTIKEIILIAQDTTLYGTDIYGETRLIDLIQMLSKIENIEWIRLMYCYPEHFSDELIGEINSNPKVVKYLDIPFQHASDEILRKMNRHSTNKSIGELINKLRRDIPDVAIRSTFMTGFPTETEKDFKTLLDFLKRFRLDNVGFFVYSNEEGTDASELMQVEEKDKVFRYNECYKLQQKIFFEKNKQYIGKTFKVLCDGSKNGRFYGRAYFQAPDVDTIVLFKDKENVKIGEFYNLKITQCFDYDLFGELVN